MYPLIVNSTRNLINYIQREIDQNPSRAFVARDLTTRYTCDVISSCLYGFDAHSYDSENPSMHVYGKKFLKGVMDSLLSLLPKTMLSEDVVDFFTRITKEAIMFRLENNVQRDDLLSQTVAMQQSKSLPDIDVVAHCLTLFLDSFETSGVTLQNALYHLGRNKSVQVKLRQELSENFGEGEAFTYEKIVELPYLDQVFYETLRLHPPLMFTSRMVSEDFEVDVNDEKKLLIKKNSAIWIPLYSIHRDPGEIFHGIPYFEHQSLKYV